MKSLQSKVALVTGASRGIGKGTAIALALAGAKVYLTGRTEKADEGTQGFDGSVFETAEEIKNLGGEAHPLVCDHRQDHLVKGVFDHILNNEGKIDILVNNVWGGYESMFSQSGEYTWENPFWRQPEGQWDLMFSSGVRAHYVAACFAARSMAAQSSGLIVNISHWAAKKYSGNVCYGVSKAATDKLTSDMAHDLREHNVAVASLYPGLVRTERVMKAADFLDMSNSESPQFIGRIIASLFTDPDRMKKSGGVFTAAGLGLEYGVVDIDGRQPVPLTIDDV